MQLIAHNMAKNIDNNALEMWVKKTSTNYYKKQAQTVNSLAGGRFSEPASFPQR